MQNTNTTTLKRDGRLSVRLISLLLFVAMFVQIISICCFATSGMSFQLGGSANSTGIVNGIGKFDSDETIKALKKDLIASLNKDLLKKVEDYELRGEVSVIITFSEDSLITKYTDSSESRHMSFAEYSTTASASKFKNSLASNQNQMLSLLSQEGLIDEIEYNYFNIVDGAAVKTTYENLEAITKIEGVGRIIISNTYEALEAVDNPVDVYETGIFNSGSVTYTGKGTLVAILDTGCDYNHSAFTSYAVQGAAFDRAYVESKLPYTQAYLDNSSLEAREVYYGNITNNKIVFGYDYADNDPDIMPFAQSHGTHVAGVIAGKDDVITGVAIDAQLAIMKVFSDYSDGAEDVDILAALEDSVTLGVDAINMSLGASCGFTREVDDEYKNGLYDRIKAAGISLIVAASNDYSSGYGGAESDTNKTTNPDSSTVGAPSTYDAAMSVASINGRKENYMLANGELVVFYTEAYNSSTKEYNFFEMLGINKDNPHAELDYVTIPGYGYQINYTGLQMQGKIALVKRGDITFEEKVQYAREAGAAGIIIYNNVVGTITMTVGDDLEIPVVSIGKDEGEKMAQHATGKIVLDYTNEAGPFMSDFSAWGPTPSLTLKPEITAHGGNILSAVIGGEYEKLSGTSMAAPNLCGIVVLIRQYVKETYGGDAETVRDLVNQLCMSTATIALDKNGNPYSPRKQGAGIADIAKATTTPAYLYVNNGSGKTKLELGDDPQRTGVYVMSINLKNLSDVAQSYRLGSIVMTESVSSAEPEYVAEMAYILNASSTYSVEGGTISNGVVTVGAKGDAVVTVTVTLSDADKNYLNSTFANGMYVEGYLTFDNINENGVDLNAPFLAFYGNWGEAPIFDLDYYEVETEAHNSAIDEDDKIKADYYATIPLGTYYYDYVLPLGSYVYDMDESKYNPIPATQEHASISYYEDAISGVYGVFAGLLRSAKEMNIEIIDTSTGEVVWDKTEYNCYKAHYSGGVAPYRASINLPMVDYDKNTVFGSNNVRYEVVLTAKLDWDNGERNSSDTYSFSFYVDYEAPSVVDATFKTEYDKSLKKNRYYADIIVYDNHYAMSIRPIFIYEYLDETTNEMMKTYTTLSESPTPIYQESRGTTTKVRIEITDYIDLIADSVMPEGLTVYLDDYAMNGNIAYIPFDNTESSDLEFDAEGLNLNGSKELNLNINETIDLTEYLIYEDATLTVNSAYLGTLTWTSSDESIVAIHRGKIEAKAPGTAIISVTGSEWVTDDGVQIYKNLTVNVGTDVSDNPNSSMNVELESLKFTSYKTLFAFSSDIDYSEIGETGARKFFDGNANISFYPSESVQLYYDLAPWNLDPSRYTLQWVSSNPKVATVDENGVVTAQSEGSARISLQITFAGKDKPSTLMARCSLEVKSEFVIDGRTLVAYKGHGGDIKIPDDKGISTIGAFAFCHYNLNNELEVEKDEDGYYDIDLKKEPIGNNTITSIEIPDGVETIEKYAFYNCKLLNNVVLPDTLETIGEYAFASCSVLKNVNFENVRIIRDYAFNKCDSLTCDDIGGVDLTRLYAVGAYAFEGTRLTTLDLPNLSRVSEGAFANCSYLSSVKLGKRTRISAKMFQNTAIEAIEIYSDSIPDYAFSGCKKLKDVVIKNDISYLGIEAFSGCTKLENVTFEAGCEKIAEMAFYQCYALANFKLPACDIVVYDNAFANSGLEELLFAPNTYLTDMGVGVFDLVSNFTVDITDSNYYEEVDGVIYSKDRTKLVFVLPNYNFKNFEVPASVKEIGAGAFSSNKKIQNVTFADGSQLEYIGNGAFANCTTLRRVTLPDNPVEIDGFAFMGTTYSGFAINLNNVTSVGDRAFWGSNISSVKLTTENVVIGEAAFYLCSNLYTVELGEKAQIGAYAFADSSVRVVKINGDGATNNSEDFVGATVANAAFGGCTNLSTFDFANVSGELGEMAFYGCTALNAVNAPHITAIGDASFADCYNLSVFSAERLTTIGAYAFAPYSEDATQGADLQTIYAPNLTTVGDGAFMACYSLKSIDLSKVTSLGFAAFYSCVELETVILTAALTELPDYAFFGCDKLSSIDLSNIVRFGQFVVYGAKLPAHLDLSKAEYIGYCAFSEYYGDDYKIENRIETVYAPVLKEIDEQAFYGCNKLREFIAPQVEKIGMGAFSKTALTRFGVSNSIQSIGYSVFEGCESFTEFYAIVNGEEVTDSDYYEFDNAVLNDGVVYIKSANGYILTCYPTAKEDTVLTVLEGTVKIGFGAAIGNKYLETLILPESLKYIGNFAFYECSNLKTVKFNSYYAPIIEGTLTGDTIDINGENVADYPGFEELYKYDFYYKLEKTVGTPLYYSNFVDVISSKNASELIYIIPLNSSGYDSRLYSAYFNPSETENSGTVTGPNVLAFVEAVENLPVEITRFDTKLINAAINAYNALSKTEMAEIDEAYINRFIEARRVYNASVVINKINHVFDMYNSEYAYNTLKSAVASFEALSAEEKALVSNAAVLETKKAELAEKMGKTLDFTLSYSDYFPATEENNNDTTDAPEKNNGWVIVLIVGVSVIVLAAAAAVVLLLLKKKKENELPEASEEEASEEEITGEEASDAEVTTEEPHDEESSEESVQISVADDQTKED